MRMICLAFVLFVSLVGCSKPPEPAPVATAVSKYDKKLVRRPGSSVEDSKVYLIRDGKKHWVTTAIWIKENGYKWPDDVMMITAEELDSMPLGEPIPK